MEVSFEPGVFLLLRAKAQLHKKAEQQPEPEAPAEKPAKIGTAVSAHPSTNDSLFSNTTDESLKKSMQITGQIPPDLWNRIGTTLIPKIRSECDDLQIDVNISFSVDSNIIQNIESDINQVIDDLGLSGDLKVLK